LETLSKDLNAELRSKQQETTLPHDVQTLNLAKIATRAAQPCDREAKMPELVYRFLIGGAVVSFFAALAEVFRPKSFAGLFGAAPSIALATLGITIANHGKVYAATEAHSMVFGAIGFFCYASGASWFLMRMKVPALAVTLTLLPLWFGASIALLWLVERLP
jgi:hypothetical protein